MVVLKRADVREALAQFHEHLSEAGQKSVVNTLALHPVAFTMFHMKLKRELANPKDFKDGVPKAGTVLDILNWFIANAPAILAFVQQILKLFNIIPAGGFMKAMLILVAFVLGSVAYAQNPPCVACNQHASRTTVVPSVTLGSPTVVSGSACVAFSQTSEPQLASEEGRRYLFPRLHEVLVNRPRLFSGKFLDGRHCNCGQ